MARVNLCLALLALLLTCGAAPAVSQGTQAGICEDSECAGQDNGGVCWCDLFCTFYNDCCDTACDVCGSCPLEGDGICQEEECSGPDSSGVCWCDELCTFYNDCCTTDDSSCEVCGNCPSENCEDNCGNISNDENGFTCWCDALCTQFDDCCEDVCDECGTCYAPPAPPFPPGEKNFDCAVPNSCGGTSVDASGGVCFCDSLCTLFQDCCPDACKECGWCYTPPAPIIPCGPGELKMDVEIIVTDPWPEEVSWEVDQLNPLATEYETLILGNADGGFFCLKPTSPTAPYFVIIQDSFGDAFAGSVTITAGDSEVFSDGMEILTDKTWRIDVSPSLVATFTLEDELPCQQQLDCNLECYGVFFEKWTTDEICDDGQSGNTPSGGINFNCPSYGDDAGVCDIPYEFVVVPEPDVLFPLNEGSGSTVGAIVKSGSGFPSNVVGELENTVWQEDSLFGMSLECIEEDLSVVKIPDLAYGVAAFTISFLFRHNSAVGSTHEYVFSHGEGTPDIFAPDNLNIYLPEESNLAHGIMRFVLKDSDDPAAVYYLDSDGLNTTQFARDVPGHVDMLDDKWHMATIVQNPGVGYNIYVDGRLSGEGLEFGGNPVNPLGDILLCARTDFNEFRHFGGFVSNLHIWKSTLTNKEVYQLYHQMGICDSADQVQTTTSLRTCCQDPENPFLLGDVTFDNAVNILDVVKAVSYILQATYLTACEEFVADYNKDNLINVLDIVSTVNFILGEDEG